MYDLVAKNLRQTSMLLPRSKREAFINKWEVEYETMRLRGASPRMAFECVYEAALADAEQLYRRLRDRADTLAALARRQQREVDRYLEMSRQLYNG